MFYSNLYSNLLTVTLLGIDIKDHIFISDREKGIATAIKQCFPQALHLHCYQYITDNLQQRFSNKVRPLLGVTDPVGCHVKGSHGALPSLGLSAQGNARHTKRVGIYYIQPPNLVTLSLLFSL